MNSPLWQCFIYINGFLIWRTRPSPSIDANQIAGTLEKNGYLRVKLKGKKYFVHRIVWEMFNGEIPENLQIDHIDGDTLNNKIENLRLATASQNAHNQRLSSTNKTGVKGLSYYRSSNQWAGEIQVNGKRIRKLSYHRTEIEEWLSEMRPVLHGKFTNHGTHLKDQNE